MNKKETNVSAAEIILRHDTDSERVDALVTSLEAGWSGRPVVLYEFHGELRNITGCHRIAAAVELEHDVPALVLVPDDDLELDVLEFAAANDDEDAAHALRKYGVSDLVKKG